MDLKTERRRIDRALAARDLASEEVARETARETAAGARLAVALEAQKLLQGVAESVQRSAHERIASTVTRCLKAVFGEDAYEFRIAFEQKRGKTEAILILVRGDLVLDDPLNEAGGGVVDVCSFALRLSCLMLSRPARRRLLVLDEPFRGVRGEEFQSRVGGLVEALAEETGIQFVISSDFEWLRVGEVVRL